MLERFTRERQRASRGVDFNLDDEDDELTHYGQSLSAFDDFDNTGLALDDEDEGVSKKLLNNSSPCSCSFNTIFFAFRRYGGTSSDQDSL